MKTEGIERFVISSITEVELRFGIALVPDNARLRARVERFLESASIGPWAAAGEHARLRHHLKSIGQSIGPFDELIAAHAIATNRVLITHNAKHFSRVPGLRHEDWTVNAP
jgi:tRNA(fMet)-specific endonuclease VapC